MYFKPYQGLCLHSPFFLRDIDRVMIQTHVYRAQEFKNSYVLKKKKGGGHTQFLPLVEVELT